MTITVTQEHIDRGFRGGCGGPCPIHMALTEAGVQAHGVGFRVIRLLDERHIPMPIEAQRFVSGFDREQPVEPFSFDVAL